VNISEFSYLTQTILPRNRGRLEFRQDQALYPGKPGRWLLLALLIPDRVLLVIGMQLDELLRIHMPKGLVDSAFRVFLLLVMGKRAPPVFHDHHQIHRVPEECHTQRTIELAVEDPEDLVVREM